MHEKAIKNAASREYARILTTGSPCKKYADNPAASHRRLRARSQPSDQERKLAMSHPTVQQSDRDSAHWLKSYYFVRAGVAIAWVAGAFTIGKAMPPIAAALLVAYPAWDAAANFVDARRNGGLISNPSQSLNVVISAIAAIAVALTLGASMNAVLGVFGVWAVLAGLFQLITGVRRWRTYGAQWAMILAGAQSAIVGVVFIKQATASVVPGITDIAPYAAFGAFYFLVSAIWLTISEARAKKRLLSA
jgi:uncharacterized membrane protein HdeD (DUF308 family)